MKFFEKHDFAACPLKPLTPYKLKINLLPQPLQVINTDLVGQLGRK